MTSQYSMDRHITCLRKDFSSNRFLRKPVLLVIRTCKVYNFAWGQIACVACGNVSASKVLAEELRSRAEKQEGFSWTYEALAASPRKLSHAQNNSASYSGQGTKVSRTSAIDAILFAQQHHLPLTRTTAYIRPVLMYQHLFLKGTSTSTKR